MNDVQDIYARLLAKQYQDQLFSDLGGQEKEGSQNRRAFCPFCQPTGGSRPYLSYSLTKPVWRCHSCQQEQQTSGDWIGYLMARKRYTFLEALQELAQAAGVTLTGVNQGQYQTYLKQADLLELAQAICLKTLAQDIKAVPVFEYLVNRGYSIDDMKAMELGAYVDRADLQKQLLALGFSQQEIKDSGLLSRGFGEDYTLTMLWRDPAGRPIGIVARCILPEDEIKAKGLHKYSYSTGMAKDQGMIGLTTARGSKQVILVEGVLDAIYLSSKGLPVISLGGTSLSDDQTRALEQNGTKELLLALDNDAPGQKATEKAIQQLKISTMRAYVVSLPAGYKDPDELVRDKGLQAFQECLDKAESWPRWMARRIASRHDLTTDRGRDQALEEAFDLLTGIDDPILRKDFLQTLQPLTGLQDYEIAPRLEQQEQKASRKRAEQVLSIAQSELANRIQQGDILGAQSLLEESLDRLRSARGVQAPEPYLFQDLEEDVSKISAGLLTGYDSLDKLISIPQGQLTFIAGRTGHGKTTFMLNLLLSMAKRYQDRSFYLFSYEEAKSRLALKCLIILAGVELHHSQNLEAYINYLKTKRSSAKDKKTEIEAAVQQYQQLTSAGRLWLSDQTLYAEDLASVIGYACKRSQVGAVFVDYIQNVSPQPTGQTSQRYLVLKESCRILRETAVSLEVPIILGAQLNRALTARQDKRPQLTDLRESGDIEQEANLVLALYNLAEAKKEDKEDDYDPAVAAMNAGQAADLQVYILKNRAGVSGRYVTLSFDGPILTIKEPAAKSGPDLF